MRFLSPDDREYDASIITAATARLSGVDVPGTPGNDSIAGDLLRRTPVHIELIADAGDGEGSLDGADGTDVTAFGDTLLGIGGNDRLAGDVIASGSGTISMLVRVGNTDGHGGRGGNDNHVSAFADRVSGGRGADEIAGDALATGTGLLLSVSLGQGAGDVEGGDFNRASAFNDTLTGGAGNDVIAGDVVARGTGSVRLSAEAGRGADAFSGAYTYDTFPGGNYGAIRAFADRLTGDIGNDLLIGDVLQLNGDGTVGLNVTAGPTGQGSFSSSSPFPGGRGGNGNSVVAHGDDVDGHSGNDTLVGDVLSAHSSGSVLLSAGVERGGGRRNTTRAFEDSLRGGAGDDRLAGDVYLLNCSTTLTMILGAGNNRSYFDGGSQNATFAANDSLDGGAGADIIVGDAWREASSGDVRLESICGVVEGISLPLAGASGSSNVTRAFNDTLAGDGADQLIGDVRSSASGGDVLLRAACGSGIYAWGAGKFNVCEAFNDRLTAGSAGGVLIGDASLADLQAASDRVALTVDAGSARSGPGGDHDAIIAFCDVLSSPGGADILVGDVHATGLNAVLSLSATAGIGLGGSESYLGIAGMSNTVRAFNDRLEDNDRLDDAGSDLVVGDVNIDGGHGSVSFTVAAGSATSDSYRLAYGGDDNTLEAFCDQLSLRTSDGSLLVGDLRAASFSGPISIVLECGKDGNRAGGEGNSVTAFNDVVDNSYSRGDPEGEGVVIVGDICIEGGAPSIAIRIEGKAGNAISAFSDTLEGSLADDTIWGDFLIEAGGSEPVISIDGSFDGREGLFADLLFGSAGDDRLFGQLGNDMLAGSEGADVLTGGADADTFLWDASDALVASAARPVDSVTDFRAAGAGLDVLDLGGLLARLGFAAGDAASDWLRLRRDGSSTLISIDANGEAGGAAFADAIRLEGFTTTLSLQQLIDDGVILIA